MLLMHLIPCALVFALASAGNNRPARMAMIAMTTNNSIKVKPFGRADPRERAAGTAGNEFFITRCWAQGVVGGIIGARFCFRQGFFRLGFSGRSRHGCEKLK